MSSMYRSSEKEISKMMFKSYFVFSNRMLICSSWKMFGWDTLCSICHVTHHSLLFWICHGLIALEDLVWTNARFPSRWWLMITGDHWAFRDMEEGWISAELITSMKLLFSWALEEEVARDFLKNYRSNEILRVLSHRATDQIISLVYVSSLRSLIGIFSSWCIFSCGSRISILWYISYAARCLFCTTDIVRQHSTQKTQQLQTTKLIWYLHFSK